MPGAIDTIFHRRSIRSYLNRPVERHHVELLLRAAMAAPTACNSLPWEFIVVTETEILDRLRDKLRFARYNAPAAIVVLGNPGIANNSCAKRFWVQDCCAATENILIAATDLGLGSVWIGIHPYPSLEASVRRTLDIPDTVTPLGMVYVGYPAEEKAAGSKYDSHRVYWQHYESRKPRAKVKNAKKTDLSTPVEPSRGNDQAPC